jgi:hydrogenase nickel incorporation protein HypB
MEKARRDSLAINQDLKIFEVSCKTGEGLDAWFAWISSQIEEYKKSRV